VANDYPKIMEELIAPIEKNFLQAEIAGLPPEAKLTVRGQFEVYLAMADAIPNLLKEIGRLRELTFRSVGEGTGKAMDIDEFDEFYYNLFIWDTEQSKVVGGYRVGPGADIFSQKGINGFYIHSLFEIKPDAHELLEQSVELGRSYIVPEYQRGYLPFFLLWQGILYYLLKNPDYRYLIGPVSISKYYSEISKSMIVAFVKTHFFDETAAGWFRPRTPFDPPLKTINMEGIKGTNLKDLENFMASIEPGHIKVPVLLKQYTKLNARFIGFNIDPDFSDALDGLMLLDLRNLPSEILSLLQEK
jgi:putative hemolysin